jgi:membrane fusion protein, multidrug efflux system
MSVRRRLVIAVAAVLAAGAAAAAATGFDAGLWGGDRDPASGEAPPAKTAEVTRQTLVDTQAESGELGYGESAKVSGRLGGTVTALPAVGSIVRRGQALYRVDDLPVVLLYGTLPAYRTLARGTEGADVLQFERNFAALGYSGFTVDDTYSAATATAVKEWQADLGLPETGKVDAGRVHYAPGAVRVDTQEVAVGDPAAPGSALITCTGSVRVITVELEVADQRLARTGAAVSVTLPSERSVPGRIAGVRTVVDEGEQGSQPTTKVKVTVSVADQKALAGWDNATARVAFTAAKRPDVLTVPVAALLALAEGGYGVEVVHGRSTRIVAVRTGMFASGRVEVSGGGLAEGTKVGMPS